MFSKNNAFVAVLIMILTSACAHRTSTRAKVPPAPQAQVQQPVQPAPQVTPLPSQPQPVAIGQIETQQVQTPPVQVQIPAPLPSQPQHRLSDAQIQQLLPYIEKKLQNSPDRLEHFHQQLSAVQGDTQRNLFEQVLLAYVTDAELNSLPVPTGLHSKDEVVIATEPPPGEASMYQEMHLGEYPVTSGKPFTRPEDYRDNEKTILEAFDKFNFLTDQEKASTAEEFQNCFAGGDNFRQNPLWLTGYCLWGPASMFPVVKQTTGGFNPRAGRQTGITENFTCTEHGPKGCADAKVFAFFDRKAGWWRIFYNICRGNPAIPLQRRADTFTVTRDEASCKELRPSLPAFTQVGQTITVGVLANVQASQISDVQWTLNGQPFNGTTLNATVSESQVPRGGQATVKFSALAHVQSTAGTPAPLGVEAPPVPISCQTTITNNVLPEPACTSSQISPKEITDINQPVRFSIQLTNTGRLFVPTVWMDGREVYRGQLTSVFEGVELRNIFTASSIEQRHSFEFKAFDPKTNQELIGMRCPGSAENTTLIQRPPECPCTDITGDDTVSPKHPAHLHVKHECDRHMQGYWRFAGHDEMSLGQGDDLTLVHSTFARVFKRDPGDGEKAVVEFVNVNADGTKSVSKHCTKEITFKEDHGHKKYLITGLIVAGGVACLVMYAKGVPPCGKDTFKHDNGRPDVNGRTFVDQKTTTKGKVWRFVKKNVLLPLIPFGLGQRNQDQLILQFRKELREQLGSSWVPDPNPETE